MCQQMCSCTRVWGHQFLRNSNLPWLGCPHTFLCPARSPGEKCCPVACLLGGQQGHRACIIHSGYGLGDPCVLASAGSLETRPPKGLWCSGWSTPWRFPISCSGKHWETGTRKDGGIFRHGTMNQHHSSAPLPACDCGRWVARTDRGDNPLSASSWGQGTWCARWGRGA